MMKLVVEGGKELDIGPTFEVFKAFAEMARIAGPKGDKLYPNLYFAQQSNEEPVPQWVFERMRKQARLSGIIVSAKSPCRESDI